MWKTAHLVCVLNGLVGVLLQYVHILRKVRIAPALCKLPIWLCDRAGQLPRLHHVTAMLAEPAMLHNGLHSSPTLQGKRTRAQSPLNVWIKAPMRAQSTHSGVTHQTSAGNGNLSSRGCGAPAAAWWAWSLLQPRLGSHPVVDIFHQPESGCLHCIALLLQLPQQVDVRRAGLMQGPSALEAPLFQLHLHGQLTHQQQSLARMPLLCQQGDAGCTFPAQGASCRGPFRCNAAAEDFSCFSSSGTGLYGGHCVPSYIAHIASEL